MTTKVGINGFGRMGRLVVRALAHHEHLEITHININDNTVSGLRHKEKPIISIQYHSEACPGPVDSEYIFDNFLELIKGKNEK